jgi:glycine oxidase
VNLKHRGAVIGGGIVGSTIAWRLAQQGWQITLFEKGRLGSEASWAAAGMLAPGGELDHTARAAQIELFLESRRGYGGFVEELTRETAVPIDYLECGAIDLAYSDDEWAELVSRRERQHPFGIASRPLTATQVRTLSPHIGTEQLKGALFYPGEAVVAPRDIMSALGVACRKRGVEIRENSAVENVGMSGSEVEIQGESFACAIIAAGAWSGAIRVDGTAALPVSEPVKGHLMGFELPLGACPTIVRHKEIYLFQRGNGMMVAGASVEHVGFHRGIDESISETLLARSRRVLPVLEKVRPVDIWTGFRPKSDALHVERWHDTTLFLAYGHYRNGILLAPTTAKRITEMVLNSFSKPSPER